MKVAFEQITFTLAYLGILIGCYYALGFNHYHYKANAQDIRACQATSVDIGHNPDSCQ
jgi:hypothetical protein